jgi:hypothetical protein
VSTSLLRYPPAGPRRCHGYTNRFGTAVPCWRQAAGVDQCIACADCEEREQRKRSIAASRRVARQMEKGFGPAPDDGEDVFKGFRGDGE